MGTLQLSFEQYSPSTRQLIQTSKNVGVPQIKSTHSLTAKHVTKEQRVGVEKLVSTALKRLEGDLAGAYYPLTGMDEKVRQQLVDDHFLFMSGDPNLKVAGMERDWPEGRGIFHNEAKTF